jgi:hypothetical protein
MQTRLLGSSVLPDVLGVKNVPITKLIVTRASNIAATTLFKTVGMHENWYK